MRNLTVILTVAVSQLAAGLLLCSTADAHERQAQVTRATSTRSSGSVEAGNLPRQLPRLATGVTELKFGEFFLNPVGPRGLEFSDKLKSLDGKRVRLLGYMVRHDEPTAGKLLLAPAPLQLHDHEYGLCDDLPSSAVHVFVTARQNEMVPYTPGLLLLTGKLSIGNREEADGRISTVRLLLDRPPPRKPKYSAPVKGAEALMSLGEAAVR